MWHTRTAEPVSQKDRRFLDEFVVKYEKYILYIAGKYECPKIPAEDIRQEALIRLMKKASALQTMTHNQICSYISHTVKTAFLDLERKEIRHSYVSMDTALEEMLGMETNLVPDLFLRQEIQQLRKGLTAREWLVLKGKYVFGYSQEELSRQLDVEPDSVRMILHRARKRSQEILSPGKVTGGGGND